jgi:DNA-binding MarR family transcriptional regulator
LAPQQRQAILAIVEFGLGGNMSIGELAGHLMIRHNSAVELVNRLQRVALVERSNTANDRRPVIVRLTAKAHGQIENVFNAS